MSYIFYNARIAQHFSVCNSIQTEEKSSFASLNKKLEQGHIRRRMTLSIGSNVNFISQKHHICSDFWKQKIYSILWKPWKVLFFRPQNGWKSLIVTCSVPHPFRGNFISPTVRPLPAILQALLKFVRLFYKQIFKKYFLRKDYLFLSWFA